MYLSEVFTWLESSAVAVYIRRSDFLFPALETVHILGFVVLAGSALMFDLRLLGFSKKTSVRAFAAHLLPWARRSLLLVIPSGFLLFVTEAVALSNSPIFGIKLILILLALLNAGFFHAFVFPTVHEWDALKHTPPLGRVAAILSIALWGSVIACGRFIAYT